MDEAGQIAGLLRSVLMKQRQQYDQLSQKYDISRTQARTLSYVAKNPGLNQKQIAEYLSVRGSSTSDLLKDLEIDEYIERYASRGTKDRSKKIYVTAKGLKLIERLDKLFIDIDEKLIAGISKEDAANLKRILSMMDEFLEDNSTN